MRKIFAITIIAVLFLNLFGFYIAFIVNQNEVKEVMMEKAANENPSHLRLFSLSKAEYENLRWTVKGKEFSYNGRVFDVSRIENSGRFVKLYVEDDNIENKLIDEFVSLVHQKQQSDHASSPLKNLLNSFFNEFTPTSVHYLHFGFNFSMVPNQHQDTLYHSIITDTLSPPPDRVLS